MIHPTLRAIGVPSLGAIALLSLFAPSALAETTLERIARTGVITAGTRTDSAPMAYRTVEGEWQGYSIEILEDIRQTVEAELGQPIQLQLVEVGVSDRFDRVANGDVDLACGSTTLHRAWEYKIDFSVSYFLTGTQVLIRRGHNLFGSTIRMGVIPGTTNIAFIEERLPIAAFIQMPDRPSGLDALNDQRIDGFVSDGILLEGMRFLSGTPENYQLFPETPMDRQSYACILPDGDGEFREVVNRSLVSGMQAILQQSSPHADRFDQWFGERGRVPINTTPLLTFFQETVLDYNEIADKNTRP